MGYNLFLDDYRTPSDAFSYTKDEIYINEMWIIVRNYDQFIMAINNYGIPHIISFDHDLGADHYNINKEKYNMTSSPRKQDIIAQSG